MKMLDFVIFCIALISILTPLSASPVRGKELEAILQLLQENGDKEVTSEVTSTSSSSEHDEPFSFGKSLNTMDVIDLIQKANKKNNRAQNNAQSHKHKYSPNSMNQLYKNYHHEPNRKEKSLKDLIVELVSKGENKPSEKGYHKHLTPNTLLSYYESKEEEKNPKISDLNDYSKIFVVLDPEALQNSENSVDLSTLVSRILSQTASAVGNAHQERDKKYSYKGFKVKDDVISRRFRRDSKESYGGGGGGGDNDMDDYRPKRSRNDHGGGGGGGGGGRTAIPYIRQRGDIYEKEH